MIRKRHSKIPQDWSDLLSTERILGIANQVHIQANMLDWLDFNAKNCLKHRRNRYKTLC